VELREQERRLLGDIWASPTIAETLSYLCDNCNGRSAGSQDEKRAGAYLLERLRGSGLESVSLEPFEMPGWTRGAATLAVIGGGEPRDLPCLALPGSPCGSIEGRLVDAGMGTSADFERLGDDVADSVVLADSAGPHRLEKYARSCGLGAAGFLFAHGEPGTLIPTGSLSWGPDPAPVPGVGISFESASFLRRLADRTAVHIGVTVGGGPQVVEARNVLADVPGRDPEAGWIIACAHYDGHDIAQGAQDNATGTAVVLEAARVLAPLRAHFEVGLRFCLFSGEEMGLHGSSAYVRVRSGLLDQIRAVVNADVVGLAAPAVLATQNSPALASYLRDNVADLDVLLEDRLLTAHSDHFPFVLRGVPACTVNTTSPPDGGSWAHTAADTLDKLDVRELREVAGTLARVLLRMATAPRGLPSERQSPAGVEQALVEAGLEEPLRAQRSWPF
jgi:Iap family predicted aminopeptidase